MAVTVQFYIFAKRENSTKQPSGTAAFTANCELKNPTSVINPEIILNISTNPTAMNYAYIEAFDRYYFVNDWTWINGLWSASLAVDALASWKSAIGNSSQYVLRSASSYDGSILDTLYPTKTLSLVATSRTTATIFTGGLGGYYVVGVLNSDTNTAGAVSYYIMSRTQFQNLCNLLLSTTDWLDISPEEISPALAKALINPFQFLTNVFYFPLDLSNVGTSASVIPLGWWQFETTCRKLTASSCTITKSYQLSVPKHPQASTRGSYLNYAPFSEYILHLGVFGNIPVPADLIANISTIYIFMTIDFTSGQAYLKVFNTNNATEVDGTVLLAEARTPIGVQMPVGQITQDVAGAITTGLQTITTTARNFGSANFIDALGSAIGGITSTIKTAAPMAAISGSAGDLAVFANAEKWSLVAKFLEPVAEDISHLGRPLCQTKTVKDLSGYVLCENAEVSISGTDGERKTISGYMNNGFFYE